MIDRHLVFVGQVFGHQRRSKSLVHAAAVLLRNRAKTHFRMRDGVARLDARPRSDVSGPPPRPRGIGLVVNYPDIGSWIARALGRRWLFLTSVHLYYFDRDTIRRMLESTGFRVEAVRPHWQRLELDYILFRGSVLTRALSSASRRVAAAVGAGKSQVPYWLGQTFVIAMRGQ